MLLHFVDACLRAKFILKRDIDYIVRDKQVIIIDENTGRAMPGRRWSNGNHQAVEAKEKVAINKKTKPISITYQNYFRLYDKLSGMTGTADTEATELEEIYHLQVLVIPTNKKCLRIDHDDLIYMTKTAKYNAIVKKLSPEAKKQQPILIGTTSIEDSEYLSQLLNKEKISHRVLNAKQHKQKLKSLHQQANQGSNYCY